ncbi:MAG: hypothetical protein ABR608_03660 [Pseudonocardiaceae bacterium]
MATLHPQCDLSDPGTPSAAVAVVRHRPAALVLDDADRDWLLQRIGEVRDELATLDWPLGYGLIHGDAWAGNLLWNNPTTIWTAL